MCGISIAINRKNELVSDRIINAMNEIILHRGPDDSGVFHGDNFAFGHRRLSIIDLSAAGHQPMEHYGLVITYNGEIYNYIELRDKLKLKGYSFNTATDTEVILAAYKEWGVDAFSRFNGMWAFAIYDRTKNEIVLSRDHFGIKPLNYTITPNYFAVASEIKQFTALPDFDKVLNTNVAINFLANGLLNYSTNTFFENVKELRGGFYLKYNLKDHKYTIDQWYNLTNAIKPIKHDYKKAKLNVYNLLVKSLKIRNRSDVPVGSCLSGGIDSSSMVTIIFNNKINGSHFKTITSCYSNTAYDEQKYSNLVTNQTGFEALKVYPDLNNLLREKHWEKIIYHQDQPIPSASHYSEYSVFKTARENNLIVMLDGQGADEYFGGYGEFFQCRQFELLKELRFNSILKNIRDKGIGNKKGLKVELLSFIHFVGLANLKKKIKQKLGRADYICDWLSPKFKELYLTNDKLFKTPNNIKQLSIEEIESTSIPYQLHSEDRNSMLFSVESRIPFLDHDLVEYVIGLPSEYKVNGSVNKSILRDAVMELPEAIKNRKDKMGFVAPEEPWFFENADELRVELIKACDNISSLIDKDKVLSLFDRFIVCEKIYLPIFFRIISLSKWKTVFDVNIDC